MFDGGRIKESLYCILYIRILLSTDETIRTQIGRPTGQKNKNWRFCVWVYYYINSRVRRRRKWNRWRKSSAWFSTMRSGNYRGRRTAKERRRKCNFDAVASRDLGTRHAVHLKHDIYCIWLYTVLELNTQNLCARNAPEKRTIFVKNGTCYNASRDFFPAVRRQFIFMDRNSPNKTKQDLIHSNRAVN